MKFFISSTIIIIIGCLSHFFYKWSKYNKIVGTFVAVNESTWEHIKLALFPTFIFIIIELFANKNYNVLFGGMIALCTEIFLIPFLFYFPKLFYKKDIFWWDIMIFIISIFIAIFLYYKILPLQVPSFINFISSIGIFLIFIMYISFTNYSPHNFLFKDPITNKYGFDAVGK